MPTKKINENFGVDRAFYGIDEIELTSCVFEGEKDGQYALMCAGSVTARECTFSGDYPLWHDGGVLLEDCTFTESCRSPLWYSDNVVINDGVLLAARAVRECKNATLRDCEINSSEFGWSSEGLMLMRSTAKGDYFALRAKKVYAQDCEIKGKYAFQYLSDAHITNCKIDSTDAFWHAQNVLVENCVIVSERLGMFGNNLIFKRCTIVGGSPLCYNKKLRLIDCVLAEADGAFEKSDIKCNLLDDVVSIRNPYKGVIVVPAVGEIIQDDPKSKAVIMIDPEMKRKPEIGA